MGLDILEFREIAEAVRESQRRRFASVEVVDQVIQLDEQWRRANFAALQASTELGRLKDQLQALCMTKQKPGVEVAQDGREELVGRKKELKSRVEVLKKEAKELEARRDALLSTVGNLVHESVPVSREEDKNGLVRLVGDLPSRQGPIDPGAKECRSHHEVLAMIDGADMARGSDVAGHRGYFLRGPALRLNMALVQYGLEFLERRGYTCMQTPFFMRRELMAMTCQLSDFAEALYRVDEGSEGSGNPKDDKFLIATSEQPISAFHHGERLEPCQLPLMYGGFSTNFRKEAGAAGKDCWGIFRVHQFEKVEQFVLTEPKDSWAMHERMLETSEEFYKSLGLSYRVVNIVSGSLNNAAAKKYDLEAWFPARREFRELVSCSNCTDYQSRSLDVRCGFQKDSFVHMLNSTLVATERALCCLLENWQTDEGVVVPEVLRPFMGGLALIKYVREPPKPEEMLCAEPGEEAQQQGGKKKHVKPVKRPPPRREKTKNTDQNEPCAAPH